MSSPTGMSTAGALYLVATPIGNLNDISLRALDILKQVDLVAAEDTRRTRQLLSHFGIQQQLLSLHDFNERSRITRIIDTLQQGKQIALVSDAGTPLISDPGYPLVHALTQQQLTVIPLPGPCAAIAALSASGLPTDRFVFEGFLPSKSGQRQARLSYLQHESRTLVFYESVHRVLASLEAMRDCFGEGRQVVIARELTKQFETFYRGSLASVLAKLQANQQQQRGEFVVIVQGAAEVVVDQLALENTLKTLLSELPLKQAVNLATQLCDAKRNQVYALAVELKSANSR